jgi:hypothetical protein
MSLDGLKRRERQMRVPCAVQEEGGKGRNKKGQEEEEEGRWREEGLGGQAGLWLPRYDVKAAIGDCALRSRPRGIDVDRLGGPVTVL